MDKTLLSSLAKITEEEQRFLDGGDVDRALYMEDGSSTINAKKLLRAGKLITMRPHTRFVHFPEHTHDYTEMVYMCKGSSTHIINGTTVVINEGDTLIMNPNAVQEILPASEDDIAVNFIILPEFFRRALTILSDDETPLKRFIIDCIGKKDGPLKFLHFKTGGVLPVQNLFENLIYTFINDLPNSAKAIETTVSLLLLQFVSGSSPLAQTGNPTDLVIQVLEYIEENYKDGSLSQIAEILHYDFFWLSREIKRKTGKTYTELVQEKRLSQTAYLLLNTGLNVDEIASSVGYNNLSYFYRLFEERFGISPKKFRNTKDR